MCLPHEALETKRLNHSRCLSGGYHLRNRLAGNGTQLEAARSMPGRQDHILPAGRFAQLYPLLRLTIPDPGNPGKTLSLPSAPNDLVLDAQGNVWFTEFNADSLGWLDPHTGLMRHYPLSAKRSVQTLFPYGVTVDPQGMV